MGTKVTIKHSADDVGPQWALREDCIENGVVYLEFQGVLVDISAQANGIATVSLRIPLDTAEALGLSSVVRADLWLSTLTRSKTRGISGRLVLASSKKECSPSWTLVMEESEDVPICLEICGLDDVELTTGNGQTSISLRLPVNTAQDLGLNADVPEERWADVCDPGKWG